MRIDYCPNCKKAGLKHQDPQGRDNMGLTSKESYEKFLRHEKLTGEGSGRKWCPRCLGWVIPNNRPYLGDMHRK
jgi:hypothetical protein